MTPLKTTAWEAKLLTALFVLLETDTVVQTKRRHFIVLT